MSLRTPRFNMSTLRPCSICKEEFLGRTATVCPMCQQKEHDRKKWIIKKQKNMEEYANTK